MTSHALDLAGARREQDVARDGPDEEAALIERVRARDADAFDTLVRRYLRRAYAVAYRILNHREDAEDLVQDVFVVVLEKIDRFERGRPFGPWFFRILVNRALNVRRARRVRSATVLTEHVEDGRGGPHVEAERADVREHFQRAVMAMPERRRMIVQLIDVDGLETAEVAAMFGIAAGTVRWHLHEARVALRAALASFERGHDR